MAITVPYSTRSTAFSATAGQTAFPLAWPVLNAADVAVTLYRGASQTVLNLGSDYSVGNTGQQSGAQVLLGAGAQDGDVYLVEGRMQPQRQTAFLSNRAIPSDGLNTDLNAIMIMVQELRRDVDRAFKPFVPPDVVTAQSQT